MAKRHHPLDAAALRPQERTVTTTGLLHLSVVYVVWGSTYLAIRVAVRAGAGFPPFSLNLSRMLLAGVLLLLWGYFSGGSLRLKRRDLITIAASGLLLWSGGNGLVVWAEQRVDSGYTALVIAGTPIWAAVIEAFLERRVPSGRFILALLVGFAGIGLLTAPTLQQGSRADALAVLALIGASLSWATGSVLQSRRPISTAPRVSSGFQHLFGALGFALLLVLFPEPRPTPSPEAWLAWGYLVLFGSLLAFTSFIQALRLLPTSVAMTYAYVNPVIAVILGALILGEAITLWSVSGAALVLLGVAGVFHERRGH